jgi:serine/threonine protein kinase
MVASGSARDASAGERVGRYQLRRWLAHGGMAELYLAFCPDASEREVVVVKRILPQYTADDQFARMFEREVELASGLRHPNLVRVYDAGQGGPRDCYLAMEYVHGLDLSRVLRELRKRKQRMEISEAVFIAMSMCGGLHHAHEQAGADGQPLEIVHRDVSPSNVLIGYDGQVKITDFGVAKALALTSFTQAGTRKGKLSYMSPEQARAEPFDRRTDVFAIGVVLFEMTTGQRMFAGDNELAIIHNMLFRESPRPTEVVPGYPPALESIVMRAVAPKADDRYATAHELRRALEAFVHQRGGLPPSRNGVAGLLQSLVPAPEHPARDDAFFDTATPMSPASRDDVTVAENPGVLTTPEPVDPAGRTEWSHPGPALALATEGVPAVVAVAPSMSAPIHAEASPSWSQPMPVASRTPRVAAWVVGGIAVIVATVVAGGWFASWAAGGDEAGAAAGPTAPASSPPPPDPPAPEATPTPPPARPIVAPPPSAPDEVEPTPAVEPTIEAPPVPAKASRRRPAARTKPAETKPVEPKPTPAVPASAPPPPPPPSSRKRAPTDTLLPILDG